MTSPGSLTTPPRGPGRLGTCGCDEQEPLVMSGRAPDLGMGLLDTAEEIAPVGVAAGDRSPDTGSTDR